MRLTQDVKCRLKQSGLVGVVFIMYYILVAHFHVSVPCMFHEVTGLLCPSCGVTRMILALSRLDFKSAYRYNQVLFIFSPLLLYFIVKTYIYWVTGRVLQLNQVEKCLGVGLIIVLVMFGRCRNMQILF